MPQADREGLVSYARRMAADDLAPGTAGNLSVRRGGLIAITPSGMPYERMTPADICLVRTSDAVLVSGPRPSTETPMHLALYQASHAVAIVHTHSPFVIALSTVLDELPAVHYVMADLGGPVRVAPYARFGTTQLAAGRENVPDSAIQETPVISPLPFSEKKPAATGSAAPAGPRGWIPVTPVRTESPSMIVA